ncbi:hypothetical protein CERSUDRAFT_117206 [Gelatoporia subvermispora B]|uniref:Uncharacterized protein n=1 Tax=Ceriporiopsis subvermispora (strain B) TaxID=914234 RepID=M2QBF5_CERS8|nr:hypothetical protein CERSUDRAFT_117206 [Gelatoporia subvermispora B]
MSSTVSPYASPPPIRSSLFRNPPESVPATEELEALHEELLLLKQKTLERVKRAGDDIRSLEESMRRLKEKEKGKAKTLERVKKERDFTPLPPADETRLSAQSPPSQPRPRPPSVSVNSAPPPSAPPLDPRKSLNDELKKKKKKRKREDASDVEQEPPKARKTSPLPPHTHPHPPATKASKYPGSSSHSSGKSHNVPDFALPQPASLLPPRPPVPPPPVPGPSKPIEVMDDFSKCKPPAQVLATTFYTSIEPYLRSIKEEDVGFLEYTGDEVEPFVMPKLGRHYSEQWEEEDIALYGGPLPSTSALRATGTLPGSSSTAPLPKWEPSTLMETDLLTEERGHGPLTERLVSALIPMHDATEWKGVKAAEEAMEGRPGTNGAAAAAARDKLNVADLEERIKNVMRYHGLLDTIPDFSEAVDDPIATALRHAQRELRTVVATNKARKARLVDIARDRLGYQEYLDLRDSIDKNIATLYTKLQKKDGPKKDKKKRKSEPSAPNGAANGISSLPPCPAALGLGPDEENHLVVPEQLRKLVQTRRQLVDIIGTVFEEKERESPGRIWGVPKTSVYQGIDEEVRQQLARVSAPEAAPMSSSSNSYGGINGTSAAASSSTADARSAKGKARAQGDDMELG